MKHPTDPEITRANLAVNEFIRRYCGHWPAIYTTLLPVTYDAAQIIEAFDSIERMIAADFKRWSTDPWRHVGPYTYSLDWSGVDGPTKLKIGMATEMRFEGLPDSYREGYWKEDEGKTWREHPEVVALIGPLSPPPTQEAIDRANKKAADREEQKSKRQQGDL